jgi:hypothetical protein
MHGDVRNTMLQAIASMEGHNLQSRAVVKEVCRRIGARSDREQQAVLTCWHDLMRTGFLAWGFNADNPDPPFAHLTQTGRSALSTLSRDPSNPEGYLAALRLTLSDKSVAWSYVAEAISTYNSGCYKASAVMVGAAGEALVLELRDDVVARLSTLQKQPPKDLLDWRFKKVLDAIETECASRLKAMPKGVAEPFESYWSSFTSHLRLARNDAGHPTSIEPVTTDVVHGSLLIFPEMSKLVGDLRVWVASPAFT